MYSFYVLWNISGQLKFVQRLEDQSEIDNLEKHPKESTKCCEHIGSIIMERVNENTFFYYSNWSLIENAPLDLSLNSYWVLWLKTDV